LRLTDSVDGDFIDVQLLNRVGPIEKFPSNILGEQRELALLFKNLVT
jgi:hypothetical protein